MRLLEELVGCLCRSEVTVAGGPRWSGFLSTCERFAGPNTELSCCPAPDAMRVLPKARGLLTQQGASLQSMSRRKPHMRSPKDALSCTIGCCNQILPMIHRAIKPAGHVLRGNIDLKSQRQQPSQRVMFLGVSVNSSPTFPHPPLLPSYLWCQIPLPAAMLHIILCERLKLANVSAGNFSTPNFSMAVPKRYVVAPSPAGWAQQDRSPGASHRAAEYGSSSWRFMRGENNLSKSSGCLITVMKMIFDQKLYITSWLNCTVYFLSIR